MIARKIKYLSRYLLFTETTESPILDELRQLDIYNMTPMEVMWLYQR